MLSLNNPIKALNPKRKSLYSWKSAISEVNYKFLYRKSFIINVIRSYLFDRNTKLVAYYINEKEVDKAKRFLNKIVMFHTYQLMILLHQAFSKPLVQKLV